MKEIQLTQGKVALVDDEDFEWLNQFKWYAKKDKKTYYAAREIRLPEKRKTVLMHQVILSDLPKGLMRDHRDGDGLNNQRENLRFVTSRQNSQNRKNITKTSQYPGVDSVGENLRWRARIRKKGKIRLLGRFDTEQEAYEAYKKAVESIGEQVIGA